MAEKKLEGYRVAILATDLFEEAELIEPRKALQEAGAEVIVIAPKSGEIQAVKHDTKTQKVKVDMTLDKADPDDFDAVLLARWRDECRRLANREEGAGIRTAGLTCRQAYRCDLPWTVAVGFGGLGEGPPYDQLQDHSGRSEECGSELDGRSCVRDGNWVSSRQPTDIPRVQPQHA